MPKQTFHDRRIELGWVKADEDLNEILEALLSMWPKAVLTEINLALVEFRGKDIKFPKASKITSRSKVWDKEFPTQNEFDFFCMHMLREAFEIYKLKYGRSINKGDPPSEIGGLQVQ